MCIVIEVEVPERGIEVQEMGVGRVEEMAWGLLEEDGVGVGA